ncbi:MAG TPA: tetratricopeptide repeat protein [Bacteroidia bacterium]|nr:tetratricopeptide repeat protein [Bacteroidia bacterium]
MNQFTSFFLSLLFIIGCSQKDKTEEKPKQQLTLSKNVAELIKDTASISPLIDSLKKKYLLSEFTGQIHILGELAENWRTFTYYLANEELNQSNKLSDKFGEGDALCKFGIYYCRKFNFDSANYFLERAENHAKKYQLDNITAQSLSWQAEVLRQSGEIDRSLQLQNKAIVVAAKINDKKRLAFCFISEGESHRIKSEFTKAIECYDKSISYSTDINDLNKITICYNSLGEVYRTQNNYPKALDYFNKGLDIAKKNKNNNQIAFCLSCMGDIYNAQREFKKGLKFYGDAYRIAKNNGLKLQECNSLSSIGMAYFLLDEKALSLNYFSKSIKIAEEIGNKDKMAFTNTLMGQVYAEQGNKEKALLCYTKSIEIADETGNKTQLASSYNHLAVYYLELKDFSKAKAAAEKSFSISKEINTLEELKNASKILSYVFELENNSKDALKMLKVFITMRDSISNEENVKQIAAAEYKAKEAGLKEEERLKEKANQAERDKKAEELKRQKTISYAFTAGFALVLILVIVVFRNLQQNKKKNRIITAQKAEVEHQKELVDEKNKEITDSITYAKRLQDAILPPLKLVQKVFPESFILYLPKDIIAGDFYWMEHQEDFTFLAAADSTGHGVPGAMVSVVCSNALNRCVKEFKLTEPGKVLDKARELVLETFAKSEGDVKDGMDISLLCINRKKKTLTWAGANNALWYIENGDTAMKEIKANKQPIGKTDDPLPFTTRDLPYTEGTIIYLITDGYADQFGGPKGKKFKYKQLEDLIVSNVKQPLPNQKEILENAFLDWRKNVEQVDDVTLLGIKI